MSYEKLTLDKFVSALAGGKYGSPAGAKRAIGKADWTAKEKEKAKAFTDKHFSGGAVAKEAKKPAKVAKATKATKRAPVESDGDNASTGNAENDFSAIENLYRAGYVVQTESSALSTLASLKDVEIAGQKLDLPELQEAVNQLVGHLRRFGEIANELLLDTATSDVSNGADLDHEDEDPVSLGVAEEPRQGGLFGRTLS